MKITVDLTSEAGSGLRPYQEDDITGPNSERVDVEAEIAKIDAELEEKKPGKKGEKPKDGDAPAPDAEPEEGAEDTSDEAPEAEDPGEEEDEAEEEEPEEDAEES